MKTNFLIKRWNTVLSSILRLLLMGFIISVMTGIKIPFVLEEKTSFIILIHIGVAVGIASNWRFIIGLRWTDPINIIGSVLGVASTLIIIFTLKDIDIPLISGYSTAFRVLAALLFLKVMLEILQDRKKRTLDTEA